MSRPKKEPFPGVNKTPHLLRRDYHFQKGGAKKRGIDWQLTFEQWLNWWISTGHINEKGRQKGKFCMSRKGDIGPYSLENIFCQLHSDNTSQSIQGLHKNRPWTAARREAQNNRKKDV